MISAGEGDGRNERRTREEPPRVSILMPVYNNAETLAEALDSIRAQTFEDYELIVVNDGSTDASGEILRAYAAEDPRIRLIDNPVNLGLTPNLNKAAAAAGGELLARHDADDVSAPQRLERQVAFLDAHPEIAAVGAYVKLMDEYGRVCADWRTPTTPSDVRAALGRGECCFCHGVVLMRTSVFRLLEGYRESFVLAEDFDLWLRMSERFQMTNLPEFLYVVRRHDKSAWKSGLEKVSVFHFLAVRLAEERRRIGRDRLAELDTSDPIRLVREEYGVSDTELRRFRSEILYHFFDYSVRLGRPLRALGYWWEAFRLHPEKWRIRYLWRSRRWFGKVRRCDTRKGR